MIMQSWSGAFRIFKTYRASTALLVASLAFVLGGWIWAYLSLRGATQPLILRFSNLTGITQIGSADHLIPMGLFGVSLVLVNGLIALTIEARDWFWGKFYAAATLVLAILIFIGFAAVISTS
jgi:hypothetical protein